ncbi:hypothetical protein TGME49_307450 [Toxoplasma gondii ME49]|uniref:Uncharacterized protein n=12 Tax=Toxoplasma gondii TaxID=5811 RepID=A0A125YRT4_TOXGV|nr:hypothetical protein TGME49_307450 [Toxoplasma gondii ME49]EPR56898.1 hypothetical protein TGGT1_307450 [Toxoplasma gondii GT1]ESS30480.1 hypothetical protein TGVEG_307450 [Toxoplasma gondii VEG]KFG27800.1 hypothetical protein TGP89_307450 [Toxoplasma gondii p89]KFG29319.1 hypothetical protein TGDOM2_307450 [Toxoplasma gondii GAB2-2007-GAL-DOM2]KFG31750.1 hypothetical protein TGFOU_307450 [Toxoplasma gondii FOU]KFG56668.1 hypothetical protein TGRUB_307450 [Toxoplasma gondii RUB]KFG99327.1|eukprot:XP_018637758.1 hypothetical protein TGME49_307450 [Toxoplasma gondii ME49]
MPYIASYTTISVQVVSLNAHVTNIHSRGILCRLSSSQQPVGGSVVAVAGDLDLTGLLKNTESEISKKRSCEERIRVACRARNLV